MPPPDLENRAVLLPRVRVEGPFPWLQRGGDRRFRLVQVELPIAGLASGLDGFRFMHLTDIHLRERWEPLLEDLLPRLRSLEPRMVLFTGDLVDNKRDHSAALPAARRFIDAIPSPLGTFAITGNHDGRKLVRNLGTTRATFLLNSRIVLPVNEGQGRQAGVIDLIGLAGWDSKQTTASDLSVFPAKPSDAVRIVMGHYPYLVRKAGPILKPDLYLTGHTHGGQVCLPGGRPIVSHDRLPKRYASGLHYLEGTWMNVSRGLGFSNWEIRTFCPPEAHVFTLKAA